MKTNKNRRQLQLDQRTYYAAAFRAGEFPNSRSTKQQKMKNWSQTSEYFFMLQSDWLKFEIELNSLS